MEIKEILEKIKSESEDSKKIIEDINTEFIEPLDKAISKITTRINNGEELTVNSINNMLLEICPLLYFANSGLEKGVGTQVDVAESIRLEQYNTALDSAVGTGPVKAAIASNATVNEQFVASTVKRAYKELQGKIDNGIRLIEVLKKAHNAKMAEMQIFQRDQKVSNY